MTNLKLRLKQRLEDLKAKVVEEVSNDSDIVSITHQFVANIDNIIITLFEYHQLDENNQICLLALGSYGREELQLHSDIDLLLLHEDALSESDLHRAQNFIQDCWDIGFIISHQLTTVTDCANLAAHELSVISTLLDMRFFFFFYVLKEELRY